MNQREIKFRAWDSKFNVMLPNVVVYGNDNIAVPDVTVNECYSDDIIDARLDDIDSPGPEWYLITGGVVPMQYIELKDGKGNEIYDGDICEVTNNENASHLQTVNCNYATLLKKGDLLIIKKLLSGFTGQILTNQGDAPSLIGNVCNYSLWNGARQLKVVGNIYQHPKLLEKQPN